MAEALKRKANPIEIIGVRIREEYRRPIYQVRYDPKTKKVKVVFKGTVRERLIAPPDIKIDQVMLDQVTVFSPENILMANINPNMPCGLVEERGKIIFSCGEQYMRRFKALGLAPERIIRE